MKTAPILNTDNPSRIICIKFFNSSYKAICYLRDIKTAIESAENEDKRGIEYIKELNGHTLKFTRISKVNILRFTKYDTETRLFLEKHSYFI